MASVAGGDEMDPDGIYLKRRNTHDEGRGLSIEQQDADVMDIDHEEHRRTDHDRQRGPTDEDDGRLENQDVERGRRSGNTEESKAVAKDDLKLMHQGIGSAFLLCNSCKTSH
jgi:hypothetical protein